MEERSHGCCTRMHQFHGANPQAVIRVGAWRLKISDQTSGEGWSLNGFPGFFERLLKAGVIARLRVALNEAWGRRCS